MPRLVCGMGTGRCGTMSLAHLLNVQDGTKATHEALPIPHWVDQEGAVKAVAAVAARDCEVAVDVAWHYLGHVHAILGRWSDAKFICLERDKLGYLRSAYRKLGPAVNPFQDHDGRRWIRFAMFEESVPKFNRCSRDASFRRYYDFYAKAARRLVARYPENVRIFPTEALNSDDTVREMLEWAGFDQPVVLAAIRTNVATRVKYEIEEIPVE